MEDSGRTTRSRRSTSQTETAEPVRSTRRTTRQQDAPVEEDPEIEEKVSTNLIEEMLIEAAKGVIPMETIEEPTLEESIEVPEDMLDSEYVKSTSSSPAIAESLLNNNNEGEANDSEATIVDADAEMVSEDELPMPVKPKINDAEEVSDEELPGPRRAELPADAEVVSEDELPTPKRAEIPADVDSVSEDELPKTQDIEKKYENNISETEKMESDDVESTSPKKRKVDEEEQDKSKDESQIEKKAKLENSESPSSKKKKKLPDLEKYWKTVHDDTSDFTGWTYLLQYVDQESDVEAAREAYDAFLAHYPYCYGYWRKYADYEKRKGDKSKAEEVCQRGLKSIPLSVDLWIYYLSYVKSAYSDNEEHVRAEFEKAIDQCGLEFRSDKLWDAYIKWETDGKRYNKVLGIYDRLVAVPTQGYSTHFNNFQDLINNHSPSLTVTAEEFKSIRQEIREIAAKTAARKKEREREREREKERDRRDKEKDKRRDDKDKDDKDKKDKDRKDNEDKDKKNNDKDKKDKSDSEQKSDDEKPKEDEEPIAVVEENEPEPEDDFHVKNEDELSQIKEKIISIRRKVHKQTVTAVSARWTFEEAIKRPYFHVKPLEKCQINNWKEYLDYEIEKGDNKRILILFERCLIACALYDDFWLKLIRFLESHNENNKYVDRIRHTYQRACTIHHKNKPNIHLLWSAFEEQYGDIDKTAEILENIDTTCPNLLQVAYRRVNVERRRGNLDKCRELYENYIKNAKDKKIAGCLAIKYSRFLHKIFKDFNGGLKVMKDVLASDQSNTRVALHLIDMSLQRDVVDEEEIVGIMDSFMARDNIELDQKILFAQRKVEFLEDFGSTSKGLQDAQKALQILLKKAKENQKKIESEKKSKEASATQSTAATTATTTAAAYTAASNYNYSNYYSAAQQQAYQQSYDSYGYNHWQYGSGGAASSGYGTSSYGQQQQQWNGSYGNYY